MFQHLNCPGCLGWHARMHAQTITGQNLTKLEGPKQLADVVVLPPTSFSPEFGRYTKDRYDPMAFVFTSLPAHGKAT